MEPNWKLSQERLVGTCKRVVELSVKDKRQLLKQLRQLTDSANVFFPAQAMFGCEVMLGHVLAETIKAKREEA